MMDCTDRHDRFFLRLMSKNVMLYTEMVATKSAIHGDRNKILSFSPEEKPLALQVGGSDKNELAEVAKIAEDMGYDEININLGCPSKKVQKNKFGACLMKEPDLVAECIHSMVKVCKIPVTAKTRIGFDDVEDFKYLFHSFDPICPWYKPTVCLIIWLTFVPSFTSFSTYSNNFFVTSSLLGLSELPNISFSISTNEYGF